MLIHWVWYAMLPKLSIKHKLAMLERYSDPEDIYNEENFDHVPDLSPAAAEVLLRKDLAAAQKVIRDCAEKHISILTIRDAAYPRHLRSLADAPLVLYYRGVLPDFDRRPVIGVVGTRKASAYGLNSARRMAGQIAACGGLVVSGGAAGIDTKALEGALEAGSQVVAVLGCGADVVYPKSNRNLFDRIRQQGCLISEYIPGTEPMPWNFLERNRIISGVSDAVLVVEAPERSGALNTARRAFELGREVFAVPCNIDVATGAGSNALLQDYGVAAVSGWDIVKEYAALYPDSVEKRDFIPRQDIQPLKVAQPTWLPRSDKKYIDNRKNNAYSDVDNNDVRLSPEEQKLLSCLDSEPKPVDDVIARADLPAAKVLSMLTMLALKGYVINHPGRLVSAKMR